MPVRSEVTAWRPSLGGVREVLHARFTEHAYPAHTHDAWTVLIIDSGVVRYDLDRHEHGALTSQVTVLPPHVPHDGRNATPDGFRKRVLYLGPELLDPGLTGAAVDSPGIPDPVLRDRVDRLHRVLAPHHEDLEAQSRLALICERLGLHLTGGPAAAPAARAPGLARRLRDLLDARTVEGVTLDEAAARLHAHPTHPGQGLPTNSQRRVSAVQRRDSLLPTPPATATDLAPWSPLPRGRGRVSRP